MNPKLIAIVLIVLIIVNLILFVFGRINQFWFWVTVIAVAFIAYKVLPKFRTK
ncbi:MAG: hypothetical protein QF436_03585 [Candidatus Woesearchaeota archaeon]|jgi:hypothetical protein|nr:hypothetical protein [Candidatus Woesearchaeota archaeon]MDP7623169.1 hypothetical protein [Candidatus Woesearchaeota archaeon]HJN56754.1 hypothetical protein [Candidatus Woesearchaeota archaeon]|tara:strand:- start:17995 stop:18153 length:159 start_codon:yes stop_codon:yes gene_type:complete